jgi:hypothetical protein
MVDLPPKKELMPEYLLTAHRLETDLRYMMRLGPSFRAWVDGIRSNRVVRW